MYAAILDALLPGIGIKPRVSMDAVSRTVKVVIVTTMKMGV